MTSGPPGLKVSMLTSATPPVFWVVWLPSALPVRTTGLPGAGILAKTCRLQAAVGLCAFLSKFSPLRSLE
jgi:hypothetical protein